MKPAIRVENLSKQYRIGTRTRSASRNLTESIVDGASALWRGLTGRAIGDDGAGEFWALKDVSFDVQPGEVVGIIGRNGAGKSTLLKVLSRIAEPTSGRAEVRGRMASLLEVGTGFHPELTGRENIYLNGSILGMSRREISRKFDEIVAFSEIEQFLDTPVKRYSSGMYVRLAFAVAAHLEPEILIVDEVLAVGDAQFQEKCLGKMEEVGKSGRTILFVSHNLAAIKALCTRAMHVRQGSVTMDGKPEQAIECYLSGTSTPASGREDLREHARRVTGCRPIMTEVQLSDREGNPVSRIRMGGCLGIDVRISCGQSGIQPVLGVVVKDRFGSSLFGINNRLVPGYRFVARMHEGTISCRYETLPLMPGTYTIDLYLGNHSEDLDIVTEAIAFEVLADNVFGSGKLPPPSTGSIYLPATWAVENLT